MSNQRLEQRFVSYGSYHHNTINKCIHIICIPILLTSLFGMLHHLKIADLFGHSISLSTAILASLLLYYCYFSIPLAIIASIVYIGLFWFMNDLSKKYSDGFFFKSLIVHIVGWVFQLLGHGVFQKRRPALTDNIAQIFTGPLFVIIDFLMFFTMHDFKSKVQPKIQRNVSAFHAKDINSKTL